MTMLQQYILPVHPTKAELVAMCRIAGVDLYSKEDECCRKTIMSITGVVVQ